MAISSVASTYVHPAPIPQTRSENLEGSGPDRDGDQDDAVKSVPQTNSTTGSLGNNVNVTA